MSEQQSRATGFRVGGAKGEPGPIEWLGPAVVSADEALHPAPTESEPEIGVIEATEWLLQFLQYAPRRATEGLTAARAAGMRERALGPANKPAKVEAET